MITGVVKTSLEANIRLMVQDANRHPREIGAVIDTYFNGFLTLPPAVIALLRLSWLCRQQGLLADGSV